MCDLKKEQENMTGKSWEIVPVYTHLKANYFFYINKKQHRAVLLTNSGRAWHFSPKINGYDTGCPCPECMNNGEEYAEVEIEEFPFRAPPPEVQSSRLTFIELLKAAMKFHSVDLVLAEDDGWRCQITFDSKKWEDASCRVEDLLPETYTRSYSLSEFC